MNKPKLGQRITLKMFILHKIMSYIEKQQKKCTKQPQQVNHFTKQLQAKLQIKAAENKRKENKSYLIIKEMNHFFKNATSTFFCTQYN